jgi:hypothetical protein
MNDEEVEIPKVYNWRELLTDQERNLMDNGRDHWPTAKPSLPLRLLGIQAVGPNADQLTRDDTPEFGWRRLYINPPTPVMFEAAARILELEAEVQKYRVRFFEQECSNRGI